MDHPILNNSNPGQAVYEPFLGSGTTLIAAETTGRTCLAMELEPLYVDVALRRWQAFTGEKAILAADGRSFDEIAEERFAGRERCEPSVRSQRRARAPSGRKGAKAQAEPAEG